MTTPSKFNESILYWPDVAHIPFIEADTRNKKPSSSKWKWSDVDYAEINFRERAKKGVYDNARFRWRGCCVRMVW